MTPNERGEKYKIEFTLPVGNLGKINELLSNLSYYMSEHGDFEQYIPNTLKQLNDLRVIVLKT